MLKCRDHVLQDLIIQYQAKYEKDIECGGGYVKVGPKMSDLKTFGDPTPYNIMFGPDKCGYTKRTHLIFSYKGKNVLGSADFILWCVLVGCFFLTYEYSCPCRAHAFRSISPVSMLQVTHDSVPCAV